MKSKEVNEIRSLLDDKKSKNEDFRQERDILAAVYANAITEEVGLRYAFSDVDVYLADYLRGIYIAEVLIKKAAEENYQEVLKIYDSLSNSPRNDADRLIYLQLGDLIKSENKDLLLVEKYVLGEITFNLADATKYVADWLRGIDGTENYILQVWKQDKKVLENIFGQLENNKEAEKLVDLMLKFIHMTPEGEVGTENYLLLVAMQYRKRILSANSPSKIANALNEAADAGEVVLDEVLGNRNWFEVFVSRSIGTNPMSYINSHQILGKIYFKMPAFFQKDFINRIYHYSLVLSLVDKKNVFEHAIRYIKAILPKKQAEDVQEPQTNLGKRTVIKVEQDIQLDYCLASMTKNVCSLLDTAWINPKMFAELFTKELETLSELGMQEAIITRESFYRELMSMPDMQNHHKYKSWLKDVNNVLELQRLKPIAKKDEDNFLKTLFSRKEHLVDATLDFEPVKMEPKDQIATISSKAEKETPKKSLNSSSPSTSVLPSFFSPKKMNGKQEETTEEVSKKSKGILSLFTSEQGEKELNEMSTSNNTRDIDFDIESTTRSLHNLL